MRYISLFSGIEAASVAWEPLGWEPLAFCEIDEFPSAVLAHRFPDVENLGDITKVDWKEVIARHGRPDVVVGGSPCQSFSVAGGRESLSGESRLMFEYVRALDEIRPRWFLWENVPGVLNTRDNAFAQLLGEVQKLGYGSLAWRVLDAQFFGVAQRRRRVFLVGRLGEGGSAAAVLFEPESLRGDNPSSREKRKALARAAGRGSSDCGDASGRLGSPVAFKYSAGAGARTMPTYGDGSCNTLTADYHSPAICLQTDHLGQNGTNAHVGVSKTLDTQGAPAVAYAVRMREGKAGGGKGPLVQTDMSGTIATGNDQTILCKAYTQLGDEIAGTLTARADSSPCIDRGQNVLFTASGHSCDEFCVTIHDGTKWVLRRLTPTECERLQGFPDGWTDVPYKGKEHPSDTPRYKACGNSMAVPVMRWIGSRIQMVDEMEVEQ